MKSLARLLEEDAQVVRTVGDGRALLAAAGAPDELLTAIHQMLQGHSYSSPAVTGHLVCSLAEAPAGEGRGT